MSCNQDKSTKQSAGKQCAAFGCSNAFYKNRDLHFFRFPSDKYVRQRWCNLIKRHHGKDGFLITASTVVCSSHFDTKDIVKTLNGVWKLRKGAVPSLGHKWSKPVVKRAAPTLRHVTHHHTSATCTDTNMHVEAFISLGRGVEAEPEMIESVNQTTDASTQTDENFFIEELKSEINRLTTLTENLDREIQQLKRECEIHKARYFNLEKIKDDDKAISFYTGFPNHGSLKAFFDYLVPKVKNMCYWKREKTGNVDTRKYQGDSNLLKPGPGRKLDSLNEFFLVLTRLRLGLFVTDLADRFGISISLVSSICNTWIALMYYELKLLFPFPSQELTRKNMPAEFSKYPTTRIILDCTEVFSEKPSSMLAQSQTWSQYKHHNTWKILVGISPNGMVTFVSEAWGGKVSDRQITRDSGVLLLLDAGDNIMVDRGFEIEDLVPPGVRINMPPFLGQRSQMTADETERTMNIASVRIHVERAIQRIKTFHILDGVIPNTLASNISQIFTICALLTNFWSPLLPPAKA